ncbi:MAG: phenylalanine--tRNA ligase subunit beta, partial [Bdellovibrionales bacterium]
MKISLLWLNDYVDVKEFLNDAKPLADKLTAAGLEVESVTDMGKQFANVVVGKIIELGKHPNADRLTVCQVDTGEGKARQIVCGAKNHKQGDFVVAALPGAVLPGDFAIKESKIREIESKGMLCSEVELGLKSESEGILILPKDAPVGKAFASYFGLQDVVLEINVTPNRADCLSHLGLAREIGCLLDRAVNLPKPKLKAGAAITKKTIAVSLNESKMCPRYAGRVIRGVKVGPSPDWLKQRLRAVDINSINNVVDVTNYVMLELGQPLHAFDVRSLKSSKIIIEKAKAGEKFISFDSSEMKLSGDELTIRDGERAVALAGIVGGKNSGVENSTTDLFIEAAHFTAEAVRRTMRRLGVQTDSAYRFSRGTDPDGVVRALERACGLLQEVAGGEVASDHYDEYPRPIRRESIEVSVSYVSQRLGYEVTAKELGRCLEQLGCGVKAMGKEAFVVEPPAYRWDLNHKTDLVEEFGRLKGYDAIPEKFPALSYQPLQHESQFLLENLLADKVQAAGFQQAVNYGFVSSNWQKQVLAGQGYQEAGVEIVTEPVMLKNPLNEELDVMRVSLLPGLFKNALHNYRYGNEIGRLFELGYVFGKAEQGYRQTPRLSLVAWGQKQALWNQADKRSVVYDLKGALESVLEKLNITNYQWQTLKNVPSLFHPVQTVALFCEGRAVGIVGALHPALVESEKLRITLALAELDFDKLMRGQPRLPKAQSLA